MCREIKSAELAADGYLTVTYTDAETITITYDGQSHTITSSDVVVRDRNDLQINSSNISSLDLGLCYKDEVDIEIKKLIIGSNLILPGPFNICFYKNYSWLLCLLKGVAWFITLFLHNPYFWLNFSFWGKHMLN